MVNDVVGEILESQAAARGLTFVQDVRRGTLSLRHKNSLQAKLAQGERSIFQTIHFS